MKIDEVALPILLLTVEDSLVAHLSLRLFAG
jgi:hypothetical protein